MTPFSFDIRAIATPLESCTSLRAGHLDPDVLKALRANDFDQAPVLDEQGAAIGVLETVAAESLRAADRPLELDDPAIDRGVLPTECSVGALLTALSRSRGVLVRGDGYEAMVTVSDLNRHRFRAVLYGAFAELESLLARLIDVAYEDAWEWLQTLREDVQARLAGYWTVAQRRGVDIGPQAAATLTELLAVVGTANDLRRQLGFATRAAFDRQTSGMPEYRNRIMHPVRPLVLDRSEVSQLAVSLARVEALVRSVRAALAERGYGSRVAWL